MASLYEGIKWFRIHLQISRESRMSVSYRTSSNAQKMLEYGVLNGPDSRGDHSEPVVIHNQPRSSFFLFGVYICPFSFAVVFLNQ